MKQLRMFSLVAVVLSGLTGCGGSGIYPVNGRVVYSDGSAATDLAGYKVEFESIDGTLDGHRVSAEGEIQKDGTFRITTRKLNDGALLGGHRVLIAPPMPEGDTPTKPYVVAPQYLSYETSGLKVEVKSSSNEIELKLDRRKK